MQNVLLCGKRCGLTSVSLCSASVGPPPATGYGRRKLLTLHWMHPGVRQVQGVQEGCTCQGPFLWLNGCSSLPGKLSQVTAPSMWCDGLASSAPPCSSRKDATRFIWSVVCGSNCCRRRRKPVHFHRVNVLSFSISFENLFQLYGVGLYE